MKKFVILLIFWGFIVTNLNAENLYFTATGEEDGKPLIFRSLQSIPENSVETEYPFLISIYWPYTSDGDSGMPGADTNEAQVVFEDALEDLDRTGVSHLMLVVTGNGRKEWHWYVKDVDNWMQKLNSSLAGQPTFPIQIENSHQPDWALYHRFISGVKGI